MDKKHLFINGEYVETDVYMPLYSPYSQEKLCDVAQASLENVDAAISAAQKAFSTVSKMPAHERATILYRVSELMMEQREELATILALEAAKPIKIARGEIDRTIQTYRFAAEEAKRIHGETLPLDAAPGGENRISYTVRKPIGVIGAITPFNFPFNLVAHKVGPAIAAGNTVVLKPASQTPLSSLVLAELFKAAGLPDGALNVVPGQGSVVGNALVSDRRIAGITFTGSPEVGITLKNKAGLKRVTLELGSNAALIIDEGVELTDALIQRAVWGAFVYNGQVCISVQRVYVHESLYEAFLEKFIPAVEALKKGDPLHEDTDITALISKREMERVADWVNQATILGGKIACGGRVVDDVIYEPTVLTDVAAHASVSCQEVFGPVVIVTPYQTVDEAIYYVNDSKYGLQAGIFTNHLQRAMRVAEELHVGGVMINDVPTFRVDNMPYGGVKQSGFGREGVRFAVEEMTELKLISIKL